MFGQKLLQQCTLHATAQAEYRECLELIPGWSGFTQPNIIALPDIAIQHRKNEVFTLIFLSRIHPKKGLELLFEAVSKLNFEVKLKIAGSGEEDYIEQLKQLSVKVNISQKIEWLGWKNREDKFTELMNADLFTLVSLNENFANVVVEALHMGTAVLVSEDVALSNFVNQTSTGWVCSLNVNDMIAKITLAHGQVNKLQDIRNNGRNIIEENFSEKKLISAYLKNYNQVAANNS